MCIKYNVGDVKKILAKHNDEEYLCLDCDIDEDDEIRTKTCYGDSRYDE